MPNYCSIQQIHLADSEANLVTAPLAVLDFEDDMPDELDDNTGGKSQTSTPIGAVNELVFGREGRSRVLSWQRVIEHTDAETARKYIATHRLACKEGTKQWAHLWYEGDAAATEKTSAAVMESAVGKATGGSETTFSYRLRWGIGAT